MKHFDLIEAYDKGALSASDARDFEERLVADLEMRKEWEDYKLARQVSGVLAFDDARRKISGMQKSPSLHIAHRRQPAQFLLRIAASLAVIVGFGFLFSHVRYSDNAIASRHYNSTSTHMRSPQSDGRAKLIDSGNYEEAISLLQHADTNDLVSKSLLAEALTKQKRYTEAIKLYSELAADPQNINREGAELALALVYLHNGDEKAATDLISRIAGSKDHDYRFEARKLNSQLNSFWRIFVFSGKAASGGDS